MIRIGDRVRVIGTDGNNWRIGVEGIVEDKGFQHNERWNCMAYDIRRTNNVGMIRLPHSQWVKEKDLELLGVYDD